MTNQFANRPRLTVRIAALLAAATAIVTVSAFGGSSGNAPRSSSQATVASASVSSKGLAFHDAMRALWEQHGAWTHMVIVSFAGNLPNLAASEQVLLQNQVEIGNAVKPYYGDTAGTKLTELLKAHILGAVTVLEAAKSGDKAKLAQVEAAWSANGREIADFLHGANPRHLSTAAARLMMKIHLEQVIEQAVDELHGDFAASAHAYGPYIQHILMMADMISGGIIKQFPGRFH